MILVVQGDVVKLLGVVSHALIEHQGCEICDGVVQPLHLDQESVEFFQR